MHRLPFISTREKICIICEGSEEYDYLDRLEKLGVWSDLYDVFLDNARGNGNIAARYQDRYQNGNYEIVLIFCDTEKKPYKQYDEIKRKVNDVHGNEIAAENVIIFGNPCTMQIILSHWDDVQLKTPAKKINAPIIEELTGVSGYNGKEEHRKQIMDKLNVENFEAMCQRVSAMSKDDSIVGSSNFDTLLKYLMSDDTQWIKEINDRIEA